jgi:hypothetical protein
MTDHGVSLSNLAKRAPFVNLTSEKEQRVMELISQIKAIFDQQAKKAG